MRSSIPSPQEGLESFKSGGARLAENDVARDNERHLGPGFRGADQRQFTSDALGPLAHSTQTEMSRLPSRHDGRLDADAIIIHTQRQVLRVVERDLQLARRGVLTGVADSFKSDAVNLVAGNRVHVSGTTCHGKLNRH
jgi:hypothetical protein